MKKIKYLLFTSAFLFIIAGCSKEDDKNDKKPDSDQNKNSVSVSSIKGKWSVSGETNMLSLEFTDKGYYIVEAKKTTKNKEENLKEVAFIGKFEIVNTNTVHLRSLKTLKNFKVVNNAVHFMVDNKEIKATKMKSGVKESPKTELLCDGEWKHIRTTMIDQKGNIKEVEKPKELKGKDSFMMFTSNGTLVMYEKMYKWEEQQHTYTWSWKEGEKKIEIKYIDSSNKSIYEIYEVVELSKKKLELKLKSSSKDVRVQVVGEYEKK